MERCRANRLENIIDRCIAGVERSWIGEQCISVWRSACCSRPTSGCCGSSPGTSVSRGCGRCRSTKPRLKRGEFFPPFLYISIINSCNLRCQGCWVDVAAKQPKIEVAAMNRLITRSQGDGQLVLRHPRRRAVHAPASCWTSSATIRDCYFQVFTNGQFITDEVARKLRELRQRHAADQRRRQRDRQRRAPRPRRRLQPDDGRACRTA